MTARPPRERLHQLNADTIRPGLERIRALLERLGNPQLAYPTAIVAGSNGKGSTTAMLASIARAAGLRVGAYTSPHLIDLEDRFTIDGYPISRTGLEAHLDAVLTAAQVMLDSGLLHEHPSYFETLTAVAFRYFAEARADVVVLEVGLGGRLDATNVTAPRVAVIMPISLEHTDWLGDDIRQIAGEKFAVVPSGGVAVVAPQRPEVMATMRELAAARGITIIDSTRYPLNERDDGSVDLMGRVRNYGGLEIPLPGHHQLDNARCAVLAAEALDRRRLRIGSDAIWAGLRRTALPGRCEWVDGKPAALLDGAHNPAAAAVLAQHLDKLRAAQKFERLHLVVGVLEDKDAAGVANALFPCADTVTATRVPSGRSAAPEDLLAAAGSGTDQPRQAVEDPEAALAAAYGMAGDNDLICVTGSLYLLGHLRPLLHPGG